MAKLTAVQVRNAKVTGKAYKLTDGYGLHLHVSKSGRKTWRYRFRIADINRNNSVLNSAVLFFTKSERKVLVTKIEFICCFVAGYIFRGSPLNTSGVKGLIVAMRIYSIAIH